MGMGVGGKVSVSLVRVVGLCSSIAGFGKRGQGAHLEPLSSTFDLFPHHLVCVVHDVGIEHAWYRRGDVT